MGDGDESGGEKGGDEREADYALDNGDAEFAPERGEFRVKVGVVCVHVFTSFSMMILLTLCIPNYNHFWGNSARTHHI